MKNQYEYTINSTDDIRRALEEAEREGYELTYYTASFYLVGVAGEVISVDDSLADLYVVTRGPAPVRVSGEGKTTLIAEGSAVVYATEGSLVDSYDSATVYAYDHSEVDVSTGSSVYVASDDVLVNAFGDAKVYLPAPGKPGAGATVNAPSASNLIQARITD